MQWNNLGDLIDRNLDLDRLAVVDLVDPRQPRRYSHCEVDQLANGVARYLTERKLPRGAPVAIASLNRAEYVAAYFGIMRAGFVAVPINIKLPEETIDYVMADAGIVFAFIDGANRKVVREGVPTLDFDSSGPEGFWTAVTPGDFKSVVAGESEVGQMLYTSGSSGRPKGVPLSHRGQLWAVSMRASAAIADDLHIIAQPLFHMNGLFSCKTIFAGNASVVLMPSFDTRSYIEAISAYKVVAAGGVATMWARVVKETELIAKLDFSSLKRLRLGSAPLTRALWDRITAAFPNITIDYTYGTTEAGPAVFGPHPEGLPKPPLALGYPLPSSDVRLVDGTEDEGVLLMRNPALMAGYHNLPEQTAKVMRDGWYYSGDVLRHDENGFYYFVGRADDMFVCSGENIYPGEVEKMLERHPQVQQAAVVPLSDDERSQIPVAFIVVRPDQHPSSDEIRTFALANGPAYQHPRRIEFINDLPWAGTNKVDRKMLIERARVLEATCGWSA